MIKFVVLIKAKQGISRAEFQAHYETKHVPLIRRLHPTIGLYRRNYIDSYQPTDPTDPQWPDFDVITEVFFASDPDYRQYLAECADPRVRAEKLADEAHFVETTRTKRLVVTALES